MIKSETNAISGIEFLAFRPSELAAAVSLSVLRETQIVQVEKALSCCVHVVKVQMSLFLSHKLLFHVPLVIVMHA